MASLRSNIADLVPLLLSDRWSGEEKHHKNMEDRTLDHFGLENTIDYFLSNHVDGWPFGLSNQRCFGLSCCGGNLYRKQEAYD